jgi:2-phospho-L-lactate guanylyltransferase (CobY/MobA/RfbA family)
VNDLIEETSETLVLPSSQVTVDIPSSSGVLEAVKLQDVILEYNAVLQVTKKTLQEHLLQITTNKEDISMKAEASVTYDIDSLNTRLKAAETQLKKDSEQGVSVSSLHSLYSY